MLIVASVVAITVYRLAVFVTFSVELKSKNLTSIEPIKEYVTPQMATSVTAALINFVLIMILNTLYERVAIWITDFGKSNIQLYFALSSVENSLIHSPFMSDTMTELPRTKTDYENSLTLKMFLFQFVNYYSSCFYIAFAKGKVVGHPGNPVYLSKKYRNEEVLFVHYAVTLLS